ncbi:hypothetical protein F0562_024070 [Nyssa sinensis]|uniref:Uncharacterized protein n=1 Tax=Nyssa sinensis TaxID=561372 RepID=A0A5J5BJW9_9ASTE|nr:hypothetical protein F0562_024070 [Nyssa sinensis]
MMVPRALKNHITIVLCWRYYSPGYFIGDHSPAEVDNCGFYIGFGLKPMVKPADFGLAKVIDFGLAESTNLGLAESTNLGLAKPVDSRFAELAEFGLAEVVDFRLAELANSGLAEPVEFAPS